MQRIQHIHTHISTIFSHVCVQVSFTHQLDMFEFCSKDLQAKLRGPRRAYNDLADAKAGIKRDKPAAGDETVEGVHQCSSQSLHYL